MARHRRRRVASGGSFRIVGGIVATVYAAMILVPMWVVFSASSKSNAEIVRTPLSFPSSYSLSNFIKAIEVADFEIALRNSFVVVSLSLVVSLILALPAAYAIARIRTRLAVLVEGFFAVGLLIPAIAILLPVFLLAVRLKLLNNMMFLVLFYPATTLPLSIILLASFFRSVPRQLDESAVIDGASRLQIMVKVILPVIRPGVALVLILNFIALWNEFLFALILTNSKSRTVQVAVSTFTASEFDIDFGIIAAAIVMSIVPTILLYFAAQKQILGGGIAGALKE